jgi:hypothetical protein
MTDEQAESLACEVVCFIMDRMHGHYMAAGEGQGIPGRYYEPMSYLHAVASRLIYPDEYEDELNAIVERWIGRKPKRPPFGTP